MSVHADSVMRATRGDARHNLGSLQGIPISFKEVIEVSGHHTSAAPMVRHDVPVDAEGAAVLARLKRGSAIVIGKNNSNEFAFALSRTGSTYPPVQPPRVALFSSG